MAQEFWRGKKVLLTGHTGFKGSWLSLLLKGAGAHLVGYSLAPPTTPSLFQAANVAHGMTSVTGDVQDYDHLRAVVQEHRPEIVIHMAAQSLVRRSYQDTRETYGTNVMGTVNLLESVRTVGDVKVLLNVTSDKCYENREWVWGYRENEALGGHDPYSSSKACSEIVTSAFRRSFFNPAQYSEHGTAVATARAGNVIGGGDWAPDRLLPDIFRAVATGEIVKIRNPHAMRPWQHVLDAISGYTLLAERLWDDGESFSEAWNFGPDDSDAKPVSWVLQRAKELWPDAVKWQSDDAAHPHEASHLKLDCSKARSKLRFKPRLSLDTALQWTVEWYKEHGKNSDMRAVTQDQISRYQNLGQNVD